MKNPIVVFWFLSTLLCAGCSTTGTSGTTSRSPWKIPAPRDYIGRTLPPPAPGSKTARANLQEVLDLQSRATPLKIASACWTYEFSVFTYSLALGPSFTAKHYPKTAALFGRLNAQVQQVNDAVKDHFKSPHPFQVDKRVKRFVDAVPGFDYPSYHSARCAVFQRVLALLDPARSDAFDVVSKRVEEDRVFAGEHFPYSIAAGKTLGEQIYGDLLHNPEFRADVAALKAAEWTPPPDSRNSF